MAGIQGTAAASMAFSLAGHASGTSVESPAQP